MALHVYVSHSGKTLELEVGPSVRVEAVQQTLADLTGIPLGDQILMCEGARLDAAKPLSAYGLPGEERGKVRDLFLYSRAHLRADAPLPPPEELPDCPVDLSGLEAIRSQRHRLDSAGSPLLRALPDYQRQFQEHLLQGNARHEASQQRMAYCARLVSEQEVQAMSIDAATANVEVHYAYICDAYGAFMARYQQQAAAHAEVLSRFEADLQYLASTELHPALRGSASLPGSAASSASEAGAGSSSSAAAGAAGSASGPTPHASLLGLVHAPAVREAAAAAARGHQHFGSKVAELEALFGMLKADVEALFMQAPSVDLEALTRELEEMHGQVDEQASIVAALSSDLGKVQQLLEQTSEQLAADPVASVQVSDTVHMLETMHETHVGHLLPRVTACHTAAEAFTARCLDCKNALTRDVFTQLRTISSQQSKIREMKNKLALFREALTRQDAAVQELLVVRRVPAAYKQCLAECVRREAFMEKYAHSAAALAERMGTFREKELAMRDSFRKHVERLIPATLLERMGLLEQPPHCQVSVSASEGERLLAVTVDDVRRIQLPWGAASLLAGPAPQQQPQQQAGALAGAAAQSAGGDEHQQPQQGATAHASEADVTTSLQLENAKLRAELASAIALDCIRSAQLASAPSLGAASAAAAQRAGGSGSGQASPHPAVSAASSPRAPSAGIAAGSASAAPAVPPEAAHRFERALAAKDSLAAELQAQLSASRQQAAAYEARIQHLESQLAALAAAADGRTPSGTAGLLAGVHGGASAPTASGASSSPGAAASAPPSVGHSGVASAGSSMSSAAVALPAAPSNEQRQQAAPDLSASVDAAGGSSLAGHLEAADVSRCLGPTISLPATSLRQQRQAPLPPPQQQAAQQEGRQLAEATGTEQAGLAVVPPPSAFAEMATATSFGPSVDPAAAAGAPQEASAVPAAPSAAVAGDGAPAAEAGAAGGAAPSPASSEHHAAAEAPARALPVETEGQHPPREGSQAAVLAAASPPPEPVVASSAASSHAGQAAEAEPEAAALPPPHPLLSSLMAGEGSYVEGVEPVSGSESDCETGGERAAGFGSPSGGYGSARSGSPHSKAGDEATATQTTEADASAALEAAGEETKEESMDQSA
ncbi:hypothetical protein ABPG77_007207 [Micractinium sp. CCAP 211/92]